MEVLARSQREPSFSVLCVARARHVYWGGGGGQGLGLRGLRSRSVLDKALGSRACGVPQNPKL